MIPRSLQNPCNIRWIYFITFLIVMAVSSCRTGSLTESKRSQTKGKSSENSSPANNGSNDCKPPQCTKDDSDPDVNSANLVNLNNAGVVCSLENQGNSDYVIFCKAVTKLANGTTKPATGISPGNVLLWKTPGIKLGNASNLTCQVAQSNLQQTCTLHAITPVIDYTAAMTVSQPANQQEISQATDVRVPPLQAADPGLVLTADDSHHGSSTTAVESVTTSTSSSGPGGGKGPSSAITSPGTGTDDSLEIVKLPASSSQSTGKNPSTPASSFDPNSTFVSGPSSICAVGSSLYFTAWSSVWELRDGNLKLFADFSASQTYVEASHGQKTPTGTAPVIACSMDAIIVGEPNLRRILQINKNTGEVTLIAGLGTPSSGNGDGGPATSAILDAPKGVAVGPDKSIYVTFMNSHRIRRIDSKGVITTIAGSDQGDFHGDGGDASLAKLCNPSGLVVTSDQILYVADSGNHRMRRITPDGKISTLIGDGKSDCALTSTAPAGKLNPTSIAIGAGNQFYITEDTHHDVLKIDIATGKTTPIAGNGLPSFGGDGVAASIASLNAPNGIAINPDNTIFIADFGNNRIRKIDPTGIISTIAGTDQPVVTSQNSGSGKKK